jgi:hypothetical protein
MIPSRMRQAYLLAAVVVVASVVVLSGTALAQSSNSEVGTWKLNLAKSKFSPGTEVKSRTVKIEAAGAGIKQTIDEVAVDGTVRHSESTANYDGKDVPVVGNSTLGDMVARTRIDPTTTKAVNKKGGKITVTNTIVVSSDGKTRTSTAKGTNALGQTTDSVSVYDKQ